MKKLFFISYSLIAYIIGVGALLLYADFFVGAYTPGINGAESAPTLPAMLVNLILLSLFALQHSVMARGSVKKKMRQLIPFPIERSTYILLSSLMIFLLCSFWQPIPVVLYDLRGSVCEVFLWTIYGLGWAVALFSSFLIDHFDLFGLKQSFYHASGKTFSYKFRTPLLYKLVRHPIYLGWFIIHWATPYMTVGQLFLALILTVYTYIAITFEEDELVDSFGETYRQYQKTTPKLLPVRWSSKSGKPIL